MEAIYYALSAINLALIVTYLRRLRQLRFDLAETRDIRETLLEAYAKVVEK